MKPKLQYNLQFSHRGEEAVYTDPDVKLTLHVSWVVGARISCRSVGRRRPGHDLPFAKRKAIIKNLCEHFGAQNDPIIFVLDEADGDRPQFEALFEELRASGRKIAVELACGDSPEISSNRLTLRQLMEDGEIEN